ncbi:MAG: 30S ribosomal protein S9 [Planctomycetota bacterium]|jgi:small subunit ribosomal protein S9
MTEETKFIWGTGRRKTSVARARIRKGTGKFLVNRRELGDYFGRDRDIFTAKLPLKTTKTDDQYDVFINVKGGGLTGQAGAISLGISRALYKADQSLSESLRSASLLTRDSRMKERKKCGQKGARASFQWTKR